MLLTDGAGRRLLLVQVMGRLFMDPLDDPFAVVLAEIAGAPLGGPPGRGADAILVDIHAEASSEKMAMAHHLDGRVSAVIGSHTHVPTADAQILPGGTATQSDAGMCGDYDSVIGMVKQPATQRFVRKMPTERLSPADGPATVCGAVHGDRRAHRPRHPGRSGAGRRTPGRADPGGLKHPMGGDPPNRSDGLIRKRPEAGHFGVEQPSTLGRPVGRVARGPGRIRGEQPIERFERARARERGDAAGGAGPRLGPGFRIDRQLLGKLRAVRIGGELSLGHHRVLVRGRRPTGGRGHAPQRPVEPAGHASAEPCHVSPAVLRHG